MKCPAPFRFVRILALACAVGSSALGAAVPADCDYLIVTDSLLLPQARRLAELRAATPFDLIEKPHVANMADIRRDFPSESAPSRSVLSFLRDVMDGNGKLPGHLVLFGDASVDGSAESDRVPTHVYTTPALSHFDPGNPVFDTLSTDDGYAALLDSLPRDSIRFHTSVGRIPAATLEQARVYVDKVEAYETRYPFGPGAFTYGFASDDDFQRGASGGLDPIHTLPEFHEDLWNHLPIKPFVRRMLSIEFAIGEGSRKPAARDSLVGILNASAARFYFVGHGSPDRLTDEWIFQVPEDLSRLRAKPLQPIASMLGSNTAPFLFSGEPSMGEQMIFHPLGVIAYLGAVGETYPVSNNKLFKAWDDTASRGGSLGQSFAYAKARSEGSLENDLRFVLLGDPALTLRVPAFDLVPAVGSGRSRLFLDEAGAPGDSVFFQLVQVDPVPYAPLLHPENRVLREKKYLRESVLADGRMALDGDGTVSIDLPSVPDQEAAAVKVMVWNDRGMRYGHFPLPTLGPMGFRGRSSLGKPPSRYRLVLDGNRIEILWDSGPQGMRRIDIKGVAR